MKRSEQTPARAPTSPRTRRPMTTTTDQILYAQPASVHFGGFQIDSSMQQRVRVHNNSAKSVRLRYTFPTGKKGFRASFASAERPSFVSAGLCEEIIVTFTPPAGFQYYYDCIQVRCEEVAYGSSADAIRGGATIIPLHAYPMVNEVSFPSRMDFGVVARGTCARRQVSITCSVPVEFEYELRITKPHPAFTIFPLTGSVPPRGEARIELEFRPTLFATASAEVELHISQLGFTPQVCMLAGSSSSTAMDMSCVPDVIMQNQGELRPASSDKKTQSRSEAHKNTNKTTTPRGGLLSSRRATFEEPQLDDNDEEELEKVKGVEIPRDLNSVTSVTFVLNQEPGKLKPKDLKKAIAANRALRQQQREEQVKLSAENNSGDEDSAMLSFHALVREEQGYLQRVQISKQVKDMFFLQELGEVSEAEKALEFQSHKVQLGQRLLSNEQVVYLNHLRHLNSLALARQQREKLRSSFTSFGCKSSLVLDDQQQVDNEEVLLLAELRAAVLPGHFIPNFSPDFKPFKNDMWIRRQRILRRLVRAVSTYVIRRRAQKRLRCIHAFIGNAKTRAQVREKVALDWQRNADHNFDAVTGVETMEVVPGSHAHHYDRGNVETTCNQRQSYLSSFPVVEENSAQRHREVIEVPPDWDLKFNSFEFMELKPRDEALQMGHDPLSLPALTTYVPVEQGRELRQGATGECGVVAALAAPETSSTAELYVNSEALSSMSVSLLELLPNDVFLRPQASVRPLMEIQGPRETESIYNLRPQRVFRSHPSTFSAWQGSQIGLQSIVGTRENSSLCLSDKFVPTADRKQVESLFSPSAGLPTFGCVWDVNTSEPPPLTTRAEEILHLSDSESDDDTDGGLSSGLLPTWARAVTLFEDAAEAQPDEKEATSSENDFFEDGEMLGQLEGVYMFERYRYFIQQERSYKAHRRTLLERLPTLLVSVASELKHLDYALTVQGHGANRPLHHRTQRHQLS